MMIFGLLWVLRETSIISLERPEDLVTPTLAFGIIGFILKNVFRKRS